MRFSFTKWASVLRLIVIYKRQLKDELPESLKTDHY